MLSPQPRNITTHYPFPATSLIRIGGDSLVSKGEKSVANRRKDLFIQQGPGKIHLEPSQRLLS
jgi:hypothetical protein